MSQRDLFADGSLVQARDTHQRAWPNGLRYEEGFLDEAAEDTLIRTLRELPFKEAEYRQYTARRRIVSYGGRYDFTHQVLNEAPPIPDWLAPLKHRAAEWAGLNAHDISHSLIAEYSPGAPLGWHRDVPEFESIIGISLAGECTMRFRRYPPQRVEGRGARADLKLRLRPRSIYTMQGEARWGWQHAVSPTKELRYSITFRTVRGQ